MYSDMNIGLFRLCLVGGAKGVERRRGEEVKWDGWEMGANHFHPNSG